MTATYTQHPAARGWQIFLSSTIVDFEDYRREVQDVLLHKAKAAVFLSEDWSDGYDDIPRKCRDLVEASDGFLLMIGYWYGSIPPGCDKSITHFEFEWALGKWGNLTYPPIAVLIPKPQSEADQELREAARAHLARQKLELERHQRLLEAFRLQATGGWRAVRDFRDRQDLRECALTACLMWRGKTPGAAARGEAAVTIGGSRLTAKRLGSLGREPQLSTAHRVLSLLEVSPEIPSACLLVSGGEDAGHRAFVVALLKSRPFRTYRPTRLGRPGFERYDTELLIQWTARALGVSGSAEPTTPQELAEQVAVGLQQHPLCFALDQVNRFPGGVSGFHVSFWKPFHNRLRELRSAHPEGHPLIAVVTEYTGNWETWGTAITHPEAAADALDFSQLLLLPPLADFNKSDLLYWLKDIDVSAKRRAQAAKSVLQNAQGQPDPKPTRVFDRLQCEALWPADEENEKV